MHASHGDSHVEELGYLQFFCAKIPHLHVVNDLCSCAFCEPLEGKLVFKRGVCHVTGNDVIIILIVIIKFFTEYINVCISCYKTVRSCVVICHEGLVIALG